MDTRTWGGGGGQLCLAHSVCAALHGVYGIFDLKKSIQFPGCSLSIGHWRIQGTGGEPSSC